jgi:hypothetical protein
MTGRHSSAVLAYIVSQTRQNVELLISQGQLSLADGREILIKLPPATVFDQAMLSITKQAQEINLSPPNTTSPPIDHASVPGPPIGAYLPLQHSHTYQARALWNYNELGQVIHLHRILHLPRRLISSGLGPKGSLLPCRRYNRDCHRDKHRLVDGQIQWQTGLIPFKLC